jgi:hypothetical protein
MPWPTFDNGMTIQRGRKIHALNKVNFNKKSTNCLLQIR